MIILFLSNEKADFCFNGWLCKSVKSSIILYTLQFLDIILFSCYRMLFLLVDFLLKVLILLFYTCSESARMNNQYLLYASIYHEISRKAVCWIDDSWLQDSVKTIYRRWMKGMFDKNKKRGEAISLLGSFIGDRRWWIIFPIEGQSSFENSRKTNKSVPLCSSYSEFSNELRPKRILLWKNVKRGRAFLVSVDR